MARLLPRAFYLCLFASLLASFSVTAHAKRIAPPLQASETSGAGYRFDRGGWKYVHLEGTPDQIKANPDVQEAYLGGVHAA